MIKLREYYLTKMAKILRKTTENVSIICENFANICWRYFQNQLKNRSKIAINFS